MIPPLTSLIRFDNPTLVSTTKGKVLKEKQGKKVR